jgi:hypothetical protein
MPCPKLGRALLATSAAAPAALPVVYLQVVGCQQMAFAANIGYSHRLEDTFHRKTHHMSFGCFKASPRYHLRWVIPDYHLLCPSMR